MPDEDMKEKIIVVRGVCGGCGRPRKVTTAGVVCLHRHKGTPCSGAGEPPTEAVETADAPLPKPRRHNRAGYVHGCRCDICKEANRRYEQELRVKLATRLRHGEEISHGCSGYQNWGCRCEICTRAHTLACAQPSERWRRNNPETAKNYGDAWRKRNPEKINKLNRQQYNKTQAATLERAKRQGYRWTSAELEIASRKDLSTREAALMLSRSYASVQKMRQKLNDRGETLTSKASSPKSPRLVTKHGLSGYNRGCRCDECRAGKRRWRRERDVSPDAWAKVQAETLENATRHGQQWTGPELEIAAREDLTIQQIAVMLGRSYASIANMRHKLKGDPKTINVAGIARALTDGR